MGGVRRGDVGLLGRPICRLSEVGAVYAAAREWEEAATLSDQLPLPPLPLMESRSYAYRTNATWGFNPYSLFSTARPNGLPPLHSVIRQFFL
jgi:hypothetical protein